MTAAPACRECGGPARAARAGPTRAGDTRLYCRAHAAAHDRAADAAMAAAMAAYLKGAAVQ